jgi:hypothetical protein
VASAITRDVAGKPATKGEAMMKLSDLNGIELRVGVHSSVEEGLCLMELAALWAGEPHSDHPQCVCPVLANFARVINDAMSDSIRTDMLLPLLPVLVGSRVDEPICKYPGRLMLATRTGMKRAIMLCLWAANEMALPLLPDHLRPDRRAFNIRSAHERFSAIHDALTAASAPEAVRSAIGGVADALGQIRYGNAEHAARNAAHAAAWAVKATFSLRLGRALQTTPHPRSAARIASAEATLIWVGAVEALRMAALVGRSTDVRNPLDFLGL